MIGSGLLTIVTHLKGVGFFLEQLKTLLGSLQKESTTALKYMTSYELYYPYHFFALGKCIIPTH
jgi:hypothetical protein